MFNLNALWVFLAVLFTLPMYLGVGIGIGNAVDDDCTLLVVLCAVLWPFVVVATPPLWVGTVVANVSQRIAEFAIDVADDFMDWVEL